MKKPTISIVVAIAEKNRVIGRENKLPWHIPGDLKRFKKITSGHPIIMGRKTFQSIGRPLPNRTNIIITRDSHFHAENCVVVKSLEQAILKASALEQDEVFIIGGGEIFQKALPLVDKLYLTLIKGDIVGDVFFPEYTDFKTILHTEDHEEDGFRYTFLELTR